MNSNQFGTFLGNCVKDRIALKLKEETQSISTYILINKSQFLNTAYDEDMNFNLNHGVINQIPVTSHFCLEEWREFFYKWCEWGK